MFPTKDGRPVDDLVAGDFEVLEEHVPQKIDAFQHIVIGSRAGRDAGHEPNTVRESRATSRSHGRRRRPRAF